MADAPVEERNAPLNGHGGVSKAASPRPDLSIMGTSGLKRMGGLIYEEFLPELQGDKGRKAVGEMGTQDPVIRAMLFALEMLMRQVPWSWDAEDDSEEADMLKTFYEQCFEDMSVSWPDILSEIVTFLAYGWSMSEIVYKLRKGPNADPSRNSKFTDGKVGWRKWSLRSQDTLWKWEFDEEGGVQGMHQLGPPDYVPHFIPIDKALLFRTTAKKGNPEGESILRGAYRPWYFGKHIENIEGIGIERDLAGYPVAYVPPAVLSQKPSAENQSIRNYLEDLVKNIKRDELEGMLFPMAYDDQGHLMYDFKLLSTGSRRQFDTNQILQRYDTKKAIVVLADFILLGHQQVGTFALADSKTEIFTVAVGAFMDAICGVVNSHAVTRLGKLNGFNAQLLPKLKHGEIKSVDIAAFTTALMNLSTAGMPLFPDQKLEEHVRRELGLPEAPPGGVQTPVPPPSPMAPTQASGAPLQAPGQQPETQKLPAIPQPSGGAKPPSAGPPDWATLAGAGKAKPTIVSRPSPV